MHKDYATRWADGETPVCICSLLRPHQTTPAPESTSGHLQLDGDSLGSRMAPKTRAGGQMSKWLQKQGMAVETSLAREIVKCAKGLHLGML